MARKKLIWYPGAFYHVMNRGINHNKVFYSNDDYSAFLYYVSEALQKFHAILHNYCLMPNHYHMLIETTDISISNIMKSIDQCYTQYFNFIHKRDGALFRGRYHNCLITNNSYYLQTSRYISLNPVQANIVSSPEDYLWSGYKTLIGIDKSDLVVPDRTLLYFDECPSKYKEFVESSIDYSEYEDKIQKDIHD